MSRTRLFSTLLLGLAVASVAFLAPLQVATFSTLRVAGPQMVPSSQSPLGLILANGAVKSVAYPRTSTELPTWQTVGPRQISNGPTAASAIGGAGKTGLVVVDPNNLNSIYVAGGSKGPYSAMGIFYSSDGGVTWSSRDAGLTSLYISALWMDPANPAVLIAGSNSGIFRTIDGGGSWSPVSIFPTTSVVEVGSTLYAGVATQSLLPSGIAMSTDNGVTWVLANPTTGGVYSLASSGSRIWAVLGNGDVMTALEPENQWTTVMSNPSLGVADIAANPANPSEAWVMKGGGYQDVQNLLHTTDAGASWSPADAGISAHPYTGSIQYVTYDVNQPGTLYAAGDASLFLSTNDGTTWSAIPSPGDLRDLVAVPGHGGEFFAGTDQGIYISTNSAMSWRSINGNLSTSLLYGVAVSGNEILTAAQDYPPIVSFNGGDTWAALQLATGSCVGVGEGGAVAINPMNSQYQLTSNMCGIFYSVNGGQTFSKSSYAGDPTGDNAPTEIVFDPSKPSNVYAFDNFYLGYSVWYSTNNGATFSQISWSPIVRPMNSLIALAISPSSSHRLIIGTDLGIYTSDDGGSSWTFRKVNGPKQPFTFITITSVAIDPSNPRIVLAGSDEELLRSTDGGTTWNALPPGALSLSGKYSFRSLYFEPGSTPSILVASVEEKTTEQEELIASADDGLTGSPIYQTSCCISGISGSNGQLDLATMGDGVIRSLLPSAASLSSSSNSTPNIAFTATSPRKGTVVVTLSRKSAGASISAYSLNGRPWVARRLKAGMSLTLTHLIPGGTYAIWLRVLTSKGLSVILPVRRIRVAGKFFAFGS